MDDPGVSLDQKMFRTPRKELLKLKRQQKAANKDKDTVGEWFASLVFWCFVDVLQFFVS